MAHRSYAETGAIWIDSLGNVSDMIDGVWPPELKHMAMQYGCVPPTKRQQDVSGPVVQMMALAMQELGVKFIEREKSLAGEG